MTQIAKETAKTGRISIQGKIKGMQKSDSISKKFRNKVQLGVTQ